ncbi:hypothetical protein HYU07_06790 [Candidatus Woesearchaeota archaeon]|nr:hypothetical protein [Candidatus Woesearchaeota archaeon]
MIKLANEKHQGIIVYERNTRSFGNYPFAIYFPPHLQHKYDSYVKNGEVPCEDGSLILASKWLRKPLDWLLITCIGKEMELNAK